MTDEISPTPKQITGRLMKENLFRIAVLGEICVPLYFIIYYFPFLSKR